MSHLPDRLASLSTTEERTEVKSRLTLIGRGSRPMSQDLSCIQDTQRLSSPRQKEEFLMTLQPKARRLQTAHKPTPPSLSSEELRPWVLATSQSLRRIEFSGCSDRSGPTKGGMAGDWPRQQTQKPTRKNDGLFKLKVSAHLIKVFFEQPSQT